MALRPSDGMLTCPACGHENTDGAKYCNECAASLAAPEEDFAEDGAPPAAPSIPSFLRHDAAGGDAGQVDAEGDDDRPYLQFGFPWVWFRTITQTRSQFIAQTVFVFVIVLVLAVFFAASGQAVCGVGYVLFFVFVWLLHWAIGRSGVEPDY